MTPQNATPTRYTPTAISLHWLIAALIFTGFSLGLYMTGIPGFTPQKFTLYAWHKWIGVTVFLLAIVRVTWRTFVPPPALEAGMAAWEKKAASIAHVLLYCLIFAVPMTGYLYSSSAGVQVNYWGVFPLPVLIEKNEALSRVLGPTHQWLNYTMAVVVLLHILAALKHHFIDHDGTLRRMLPRLKNVMFTAGALVFAAFALNALTPTSVLAQADDPGNITIVAKQMGIPIQGSFKRFDTQVHFDPNDLAQSSAHITLDMASIDLGTETFNKEVRGRDWFDVAQFQKASFVSTQITKTEAQTYTVAGQLTIKGKTIEVSIPTRYQHTGTHQIFEGVLPIRRLVFGIGEGDWKDTSIVADEVTIRFRIVQ